MRDPSELKMCNFVSRRSPDIHMLVRFMCDASIVHCLRYLRAHALCSRRAHDEKLMTRERYAIRLKHQCFQVKLKAECWRSSKISRAFFCFTCPHFVFHFIHGNTVKHLPELQLNTWTREGKERRREGDADFLGLKVLGGTRTYYVEHERKEEETVFYKIY